MSLIENMGIIKKERVIKMIPVELLVDNPDNFYSVGEVDELKHSIIAAGGVRQNLIVEPMDDGKYMIISGHRRCKAVRELLQANTIGISETVPCEVSTDHYGNQLLLIETNRTARSLNAWEKVEQYRQLSSLFKYGVMTHKVNGRKRDAIAEILQESKTNIARYSAISNSLLDEYKDWLKNNKLGISAAYELSKLTPAQQKDFYEEHAADEEITIRAIKLFETQLEERNDDGNDADETREEKAGVAQPETGMTRSSIETKETIKTESRGVAKEILSESADAKENDEIVKKENIDGYQKLRSNIGKVILRYREIQGPHAMLNTMRDIITHYTARDYIGIDDCDGQKIFEGDFLEIQENSQRYYAIVYYQVQHAQYMIGIMQGDVLVHGDTSHDLPAWGFSGMEPKQLKRLGNVDIKPDVGIMIKAIIKQMEEDGDLGAE